MAIGKLGSFRSSRQQVGGRALTLYSLDWGGWRIGVHKLQVAKDEMVRREEKRSMGSSSGE